MADPHPPGPDGPAGPGPGAPGGSQGPAGPARAAGAMRQGLVLRLWLLASATLLPLAGRLALARRRRAGKEDPARWREKLGEPSAPRPAGPLVWMHAVGVGEVLALTGLVAALRRIRPDVRVLVTSTSRTSGEALAPNLPEGALHQYLPVDARPWLRAFLDHWRPDVSVWAEQDIWPAAVVETAARGIPLVLVNGRMNAASLTARRRAGGLYRDLYGRFGWIGVQDEASRASFAALGVPEGLLHVAGSLKAGAPALADQLERREELARELQGRRIWIAASTHPGEEEILAEAQARLVAEDPAACLIVAPRDPSRAVAVAELMSTRGIRAEALPGDNRLPGPADAYVVSRIGQLGLWFRLADTAFVGGSLVAVGGHNPWEPARLGCAVLHGPHVENFAEDYAAFHAAGAAREVADAPGLIAALEAPDLPALREAAGRLSAGGAAALAAMAEVIAARLPPAVVPPAEGAAP